MGVADETFKFKNVVVLGGHKQPESQKNPLSSRLSKPNASGTENGKRKRGAHHKK